MSSIWREQTIFPKNVLTFINQNISIFFSQPKRSLWDLTLMITDIWGNHYVISFFSPLHGPMGRILRAAPAVDLGSCIEKVMVHRCVLDQSLGAHHGYDLAPVFTTALTGVKAFYYLPCDFFSSSVHWGSWWLPHRKVVKIKWLTGSDPSRGLA